MILRRDDSDKQRAILALSFEPAENGYLYYHWRWSRGVPVTAEERDSVSLDPSAGIAACLEQEHCWSPYFASALIPACAAQIACGHANQHGRDGDAYWRPTGGLWAG